MNFLTTAQMLMDMRTEYGPFHYRIDADNQTLVMEFRIDPDVPQMFEDARRMFEPV